MRGLRTSAPWGGGFMRLFGGLLAELESLFWCLDLQSGPFSITSEADFDRLDRELEGYWLDVPVLAGTSTGLWRPGVLSRFGRFLVEDEWSYMLGIPGPEEAARSAVARLPRFGHLDAAFFRQVAERASVFIMTEASPERSKSMWEVYATQTRWLERLQEDPWWVSIESDARVVAG